MTESSVGGTESGLQPAPSATDSVVPMNGSPYQFLLAIRWAVAIVVLLAMAWFVRAYWGLQAVDVSGVEADGASPTYDWPAPATFAPGSWTVVQRRGGSVPAQMGPLGQRFRLAGTFFAYPGDGDPAHSGTRHAIVDDVQQQQQHLLQEGDEVDAIRVVSIFRDRIVLRGPAGEEELWLSFTSKSSPGREPPARDRAETPLRFEDMPALETSRFGKRIGENRWVFQRDELVRYMDELQDDPERLTAIFMAMQPDYDEDEEHITGFRLDKLGEDVLYDAAGFQNGDIVREVNSIPMTSAARAEYLIREFVNERISAVVFDIERDGRPEKLIHLIR